MNKPALLAGACALALMLEGPALAQSAPTAQQGQGSGTAIQEVVVTARRREESVQKTPVSVAAVTPVTLQRANIERISDLSRAVAGLTTAETASFSSGATAFIRGIGTSESSLAVDSPVGMYRDGVYLGHANTTGNEDLTTLQRVEVLRGPQGTLFGRNTTGGAINFVTREPDTAFGITQFLRYGSFNEFQATSTIDTGALGSSGLSAVVTYSHHQRDGYVDDPTRPSSQDPGAYRYDSVFAKLRGEWGAFSFDYSVDFFEQSAYDQAFQLTAVSPTVAAYYANSPGYGGSSLTVSPQRLGTLNFVDFPPQHTISWSQALTTQYRVSDALLLKSITGFSEASPKDLFFTVGDAGLLGLTTSSPVTPVSTVPYQILSKFQKVRLFTEEVQALGTIGPFTYTVGSFYLAERASESNQGFINIPISPTLAFPTLSSSIYSTKSASHADYGQISYTPGWLSGLELTGGIRQTWDRKSVVQVEPAARAQSEPFEATTYTVSAKYQWTPDVMTFVRYATGYRAGGFNIRAGAGQNFLFEPERADTVEGGLKSEFFDRRVRFDAGVFHTTYRDLQVTTFNIVAGQTIGGQTYNANATFQGGELELTVNPVRGLTLNGNVGYVDPKYQQIFFINPATGILQNYASSAQFPYVSKWNGNLDVDYTFGGISFGKLDADLGYSFQSNRYFGLIDLPGQSPFNSQVASGLVYSLNGRLTLGDLHLAGHVTELSVWADNLTNRFNRVGGIDFGFGIAGNYYSPPRTVGIDLKVKL